MANNKRLLSEDEDIRKAFLANPEIAKRATLLAEIGVLNFIDQISDKIGDYKTLLARCINIFNCIDVEDIMDVTVRNLWDICSPSFVAFLWKPNQNRSEITLRSYRERNLANLGIRLDGISELETFFASSSKPALFSEIEKELRDTTTIGALKEALTEVVVPINGPLDLYGVVLIGSKSQGGKYEAKEIAFLDQLMVFVSQAIKNHLHYEHSLRDTKTGLYNHGFFMTRLKEECARVKRLSGTSSVIMLDIDRFKPFNDAHGHLAGDKVLEALSHVIKQGVRVDDIPSRFGGEEFTILLPGAEAATAFLVAERLRDSVSRMHVPWEKPLPQITISLGIFSFDDGEDLSTGDVVKRADEAMYASKQKGKNCTTAWEPGIIDRFSVQGK
ncbi:MAG: GGDEF domain-containing protein [Treponema sp.]|nr:GGDEF domain-containing protein [Treponema sp.]